jgi:hypothetical protein
VLSAVVVDVEDAHCVPEVGIHDVGKCMVSAISPASLRWRARTVYLVMHCFTIHAELLLTAGISQS